MSTLNTDPSIRTNGSPIVDRRPRPADLLVNREHRPDNMRFIGDLQWQQRIERAVEKARRMTQKAWRLDITGDLQGGRLAVFTVRSSTHAMVWYVQHVHESGISCTCEAGSRYMPCWHAARVALRLCREYRPFLQTALPSSPYELFEEPELDSDDFTQRTLDIPSLIEWDVVPAICTACGAENEPGSVACSVCGVMEGESFADLEPIEEYEFSI